MPIQVTVPCPGPANGSGTGGRRGSGRRRIVDRLDQPQHLLGGEVAGHEEEDVLGHVAALVVLPHPVAPDPGQRVVGADDRPGVGGLRRGPLADRQVGVVVRPRAVLGDLLEDDLALLVVLLLGDRRIEQHRRLDLEAPGRLRRRHQHRVVGVVLVGVGVAVAADAVHRRVQLLLAHGRGAVEEQVLEQVRGAREVLRLEGRARPDDGRGGDHRHLPPLQQGDPQAVRQDGLQVARTGISRRRLDGTGSRGEADGEHQDGGVVRAAFHAGSIDCATATKAPRTAREPACAGLSPGAGARRGEPPNRASRRPIPTAPHPRRWGPFDRRAGNGILPKRHLGTGCQG